LQAGVAGSVVQMAQASAGRRCRSAEAQALQHRRPSSERYATVCSAAQKKVVYGQVRLR